MENSTDFRFDGGATWSNLLATQGQSFGAHPIERLPTPHAASRWLTLVGYPPTDPMTDTDLDNMIRLREALRDLAMAAVAGRAAPPQALTHVHAVASAPTRLAFPAHLAFPAPPEHGIPMQTALSLIAIQALVSLQGPDRDLLKECAEVDCRWVFLDTSGRRTWCPSPACASRGRVRAHRARQTPAPSRTRPSSS
ncbi:CGNR zinc finger domain-containing protein [Herbiconiux liukaitaii]|uniref:CGNR zinc finger domain-containing protein n=1 Tax=Herbiconiux liukaitaii TaxID=3342799 RepID=UPI0035B810B2